jgi:hypothetical protein
VAAVARSAVAWSAAADRSARSRARSSARHRALQALLMGLRVWWMHGYVQARHRRRCRRVATGCGPRGGSVRGGSGRVLHLRVLRLLVLRLRGAVGAEPVDQHLLLLLLLPLQHAQRLRQLLLLLLRVDRACGCSSSGSSPRCIRHEERRGKGARVALENTGAGV